MILRKGKLTFYSYYQKILNCLSIGVSLSGSSWLECCQNELFFPSKSGPFSRVITNFCLSFHIIVEQYSVYIVFLKCVICSVFRSSLLLLPKKRGNILSQSEVIHICFSVIDGKAPHLPLLFLK